MAEINEREFVIPLRREFLKVPYYRRAGRAAKAIKQFIAKHMKVADRDASNVRLDIYLNNEIWCRGRTNPPSKIKVKARREGNIVKVELAEIPQHLKFLKAKHEKLHKAAEKKEERKEEVKEEKTAEDKKEEKTEKKAETEKEKSGEEEQIKEAKMEQKAAKHVSKVKEPEIQRRAMNRH